MFGLSAAELGLIFLIVILLFGGKRLPQLAKGVAQSIAEFKNGLGVEECDSDSFEPKFLKGDMS